MQRRILIVAGCHRSGTSALTALLGQSGWALPQTLIQGGKWNTRGYFESSAVRDFHDRILSALDRPVYDFRSTPTLFDTPAFQDACIGDLDALLVAEFGEQGDILVKDPRLCRLLPIWRRYAEVAGCNLNVVVPLRHPEEVARSLKDRNGFSRLEGLLVWLRETIFSVMNSRTLSVSFQTFEQLLQSEFLTLQTLARDLDVKFPVLSEQEVAIVPELRHHVFEQGEQEDTALSQLAQALYTQLSTTGDGPAVDLANDCLERVVGALGIQASAGGGASDLLEQMEALLTPMFGGVARAVSQGLVSDETMDLPGFLQRFEQAHLRQASWEQKMQDQKQKMGDVEEDLLLTQNQLRQAQSQLTARVKEMSFYLEQGTEIAKTVQHRVVRVPRLASPPKMRFLMICNQPSAFSKATRILQSQKEVFMLGQAFLRKGSTYNFYSYLGEDAGRFGEGKLADDFERYLDFEGEVRAKDGGHSTHIGCLLTPKQFLDLPAQFRQKLLASSRLVHLAGKNVLYDLVLSGASGEPMTIDLGEVLQELERRQLEQNAFSEAIEGAEVFVWRRQAAGVAVPNRAMWEFLKVSAPWGSLISPPQAQTRLKGAVVNYRELRKSLAKTPYEAML